MHREEEENKELDIDSTDIPSGKFTVSNWDIFHMGFSIVVHVIDIGLDINVAVQYLLDGKMAYFGSTLVLILLPSFINTVVSRQMQRQDEKIKDESKNDQIHCGAIKRYAKNLFILAFQITPALRYFYCLKYALRAPFHQIGSIFSSLASMGWAMATYHRSIRLAQWNKSNIGKTGMILQFLWHFFITVSRIISICAVASISVLFTTISCLIHWLGMTIWIVVESRGVKNFCKDRKRAPHTPLTVIERLHSAVFAGVLGIVYIFVYLKHGDTDTYLHHACFYAVCGIENLTATLIWIYLAPKNFWFRDIVPALATVPFILGLICLGLYYKYFHPRSKNEKFYFQNNVQPSAA